MIISRMLRPIFHATVLAIDIYTIVYDQLYMDIPFPAEGYKEIPFRARIGFATFWCLYLQTLYFGLALLNDFFGSNEVSPRNRPLIRTIKDLVFSLAFPTGLLISFTFWSIYVYQKELVFPDYVENIIPLWGNIVLHVTNSVFISIEIVVSRITYPSRPVGLGLAMIFNTTYLYCLIDLRLRTGVWLYPLFNVMDVPTTGLFFVMSLTLGLLFYFLGEHLSSVINLKSVNKYQVKKKK